MSDIHSTLPALFAAGSVVRSNANEHPHEREEMSQETKSCYIILMETYGYVLVQSPTGKRRHGDWTPLFKGSIGCGRKTEREARSLACQLGYTGKRMRY